MEFGLEGRLEISIDGVPCPDPWNEKDWVFERYNPISGMRFDGVSGKWRKKTIEEKEMEEAMKEVNLIAPGWKE